MYSALGKDMFLLLWEYNPLALVTSIRGLFPQTEQLGSHVNGYNSHLLVHTQAKAAQGQVQTYCKNQNKQQQACL